MKRTDLSDCLYALMVVTFLEPLNCIGLILCFSGSLIFSNTVFGDGNDVESDEKYMCNAKNTNLLTTVGGSLHQLTVDPSKYRKLCAETPILIMILHLLLVEMDQS